MNPQIDPKILQMLMQMMMQKPDVKAGNMPMKFPSGTVPGMAKTPTPTEQVINMFVSMANQAQPQKIQNGMMGVQGGPMGGLGGRPRGS